MKLNFHVTAAGEPVVVQLITLDPESVLLASVSRSHGLRLKSTYLSRLGEPPVLISHWPTCRGHNRPLPAQRQAHDMVGRSFEHSCLLDHLAELQNWVELLTDLPAAVMVPLAQIDRIPLNL